MTRAIDLTARQHRTVLALLSRYLPNTTVWAYGSRVKWTSRPASDLDLVAFAEPEQAARVTELREAFDESDLPFQVDLFMWRDVPVDFRKRIEVEHVVLKKSVHWRKKWPRMTLGSVTRLTLSNVDKNTKLGEEPVRLCNYMDVYSNRYIRSYFDFMTATATKREIERCGLQPGDVVITKDSEQHDDIGVPSLVHDPCVKDLVCGYHLAVLRPESESVLGPYLLYALQTTDVRHQFSSYANGVTRFSLRKDDILRVKIPLPPLPEQRAIARILGALDDKIELNRRMNKTLGGMMQALFKSWFMDFDPVRAKMERRDIGLPQNIADLFPKLLAESELGHVPEGWSIGCISDIASCPRQAIKPSELPHESPYIGLEHMPRQSIALTDWGQAKKVKSSKLKFAKGDILFGKLRPYFHKVGVAPLSGVCSTDIMVMAPKKPQWAAFLLACVSSTKAIAYANQASTGTKMPRTNWKAMSDYRCCLPQGQMVCAFQNLVQPMLDRIIANIHDSRALALRRDALLPKLMSGDMLVSPSDVR